MSMANTITVEDAQASLKSLIHQLAAGDEVIITENQRPVARLIGESTRVRRPRTPGNCKGMIALLIEDDEHLEGFADYMP